MLSQVLRQHPTVPFVDGKVSEISIPSRLPLAQRETVCSWLTVWNIPCYRGCLRKCKGLTRGMHGRCLAACRSPL